MDGLHLRISPHRVPTLVVEFVRRGRIEVQALDGVRHKVFVRIRFRDESCVADFEYSLEIVWSWDEASKTYESFVHVLNVNKFRGCLNVKKALTETRWEEFREQAEGP